MKNFIRLLNAQQYEDANHPNDLESDLSSLLVWAFF